MQARPATTRAGLERPGTPLPPLTDHVSLDWDQRLSREEMCNVRMGLPYPLSMDDRLLAYCDTPTPSGALALHLWHSWGGRSQKWMELDLVLDANEAGGHEGEGARIVQLRMARDAFFLTSHSEEGEKVDDEKRRAVVKECLRQHFQVDLKGLWDVEYTTDQ